MKFRHGIVPISIEVSKQTIKQPIDLRAAARGKKIYKSNCMSCHGSDGRGGGLKSKQFKKIPANLADLSRTVPSFKFYMHASRFKGEMPGWKTMFSKRELRDLENYIVSLGRM